MTYLNMQGRFPLRPVHSCDNHARNLARDHIVCHPKLDDVIVKVARQEFEHVMIHPKQVSPMLKRVFETLCC